MAFFSTNSSDYAAAINKLTKPKYESKYENNISDLMNKITNREKFSYDFNADPLYQNYKDNYMKLGNEAAMNAASAVASQTGGFGNSYAATAASQANQQYLTQLNNVIPELYNAAMNKYKMETEDLYNQFGMYETEEQRLYGQHRDNVSDYYSDWNNLQSGYGTALSKEQWEAEMAYRQERDQIADSQWQQNFDNSNYWKQLEYNLAQQKKAKGSGSGSSSKTSATTTTATPTQYGTSNSATRDGSRTSTQYTNAVNDLGKRTQIQDRLLASSSDKTAEKYLMSLNLSPADYNYFVDLYNKSKAKK